MTSIDVEGLRDKVKAMYQAVADEPQGTFHFEMGYGLAARLGYPTTELDEIPAEAIESFAGVGHHLALAGLQPGDRVVDLGSGSGTDAFLAARRVGADGEADRFLGEEHERRAPGLGGADCDEQGDHDLLAVLESGAQADDCFAGHDVAP